MLHLIASSAQDRGYLVYRAAGDSFVDLVLAHPRRPAPVWALTLRAPSRAPQPRPQAWLDALAQSTRLEGRLVQPCECQEVIERLGRSAASREGQRSDRPGPGRRR
jgi:hypothetical protein